MLQAMGDLAVENLVYSCIIFIGVVLTWYLFRITWPGWMGFPFALLTMQATRDLGIAPLTLNLLGYEYSPEVLFPRAHGIDAWRGGSVIFLSYASIAFGMFLARYLWAILVKSAGDPWQLKEYAPQPGPYTWRIALAFFVVGLIANLITIAYLLPGRSIADLASERALYSDEYALSSPFYGYMRLLSPIMQIGALAMVFFAGTSRSKRWLALVANLLYTSIETLHGGRTRVVISVLSLMLAYHYGVKPLKPRHFLNFAVIALACFVVISLTRFDSATTKDVQYTVFRSIFASDFSRIDDAAWILDVFPNRLPFSGWQNLLGSIVRFIPRVTVPGTNTLWGYVVDYFYGGVNPMRGIGGGNYATGAESYSWGGYASVISFGLLAGGIFGVLFEWQRRSPHNPYLKILALLILVWPFFLGIQSRLPVSIGQTGFALVPVAIMAALAAYERRGAGFILLLYFNFVALFAWYVFRDWLDVSLLRLAILASIPLVYVFAVKILSQASPQVSRVGYDFRYDKLDGISCRQVGQGAKYEYKRPTVR